MRILYLMHVDWRWAKQRPHFVAEHLSARHDVTVAMKRQYSAHALSPERDPTTLRLLRYFVLPLARFPIIDRLNDLLARFRLSFEVRKSDAVWITFPTMYALIRGIPAPGQTLVYDCMDDALEFPSVRRNATRREAIRTAEAELIERSTVVFCTSEHLRRTIVARYGEQRKITVVNNAISLPSSEQPSAGPPTSAALKTLQRLAGTKVLYIGTISHWFDFDLVLAALDRFDTLTFILIGPAEIASPTHERLVTLPPVEHRAIFDLMQAADALVMPFQVNELVLSVNPVKVYEYIHAGKPALVVSYPETECFQRYVHLYRSQEDFLALIERLVAGDLAPPVTHAEAQAFVRRNTWRERVADMTSVLGWDRD